MPGASNDNEKAQPGAEQDETKDTQDTSKKEGDGGSEDESDDAKWTDPKAAAAEIKKLRAENAKARTARKTLDEEKTKLLGTVAGMKKALGLEEESQDPAAEVSKLKAENEALQLQLSINSIARDLKIPPESEKYFQFLLAQKFETLKDTEEISDEDLEEIRKEVHKASGRRDSSTGVDDGGTERQPNEKSEITAEQFSKMNTGEKSALYVKNPALYQQLFEQAKAKKIL